MIKIEINHSYLIKRERGWKSTITRLKNTLEKSEGKAKNKSLELAYQQEIIYIEVRNKLVSRFNKKIETIINSNVHGNKKNYQKAEEIIIFLNKMTENYYLFHQVLKAAVMSSS
jgi:hypothetical protein